MALAVIVDYELGNLRSVAGAVEKVGHNALVSSQVEDLQNADKLILPGVGAFGDGMANLHRLGLVEPLSRLVLEQGKPILGICLGSQLLARESSEFGHHEGLGWVDATVVKIDTGDEALRIPHVGWNELIQVKKSSLLEGISEDALFYYVHSFQVKCEDARLVTGECEYGTRLTAVFEKDNIFATQFHPEKSQLDGLRLLKNFLEAT